MTEFRQTPEGGAPLAGPNPHFFSDPIMDCLTNMVLELGAQVWVLKERIAAQEEALHQQGVLTQDAVEAVELSAEKKAALKKERDDFVASLLREIQRLAEPDSQGT